MKIKIELVIFCCFLALAVWLAWIKPSGKTVYFYPGYFAFQESDQEDVFLYGINLSEICREKGLVTA